jgi:mRNA interferase RelE/StbE
MKIEYSDRFSKDIDKITEKSLMRSIDETITKIKLAKGIHELSNIKKMKGHESAYRIRIGDYRIGIFVKEDTVIFVRVLHRKDIYRVFP